MEVFRDEDEGAGAGAAAARCWNHNVAYHGLIRRTVPRGARELLDVGCGDGRLARVLAGPGRRVVGLERDPAMLARARALGEGVVGLEFEAGDFLAYQGPSAGFDFICFLSSLHHMDQAAALAKAGELLRPGGRLVVVGLAHAVGVKEELVSAAYALPAWFGGLRPENAGGGPEGMPVLDPELSWGESRAVARRTLPGVRYRRRLYFRYSLRWTKPGTDEVGEGEGAMAAAEA